MAFGQGNFTRGAGRRGNRKGRTPVYRPEEFPRATAIMLSDHARTVAALFGRGSVSKGIRIALESLAALCPRIPESENQARLIWSMDGPREHAGWRQSVATALTAVRSAADPQRLEAAAKELEAHLLLERAEARRLIRVEARRLKGAARLSALMAELGDEWKARQTLAGCSHAPWKPGQLRCRICEREDAEALPEPGTDDSGDALPDGEAAAPAGNTESGGYDLFSDPDAPAARITAVPGDPEAQS